MIRVSAIATVIICFVFLTGCSSVSNHFTSKPPEITKLGSNKHHIEFAVKEATDAEGILEENGKSICKGRAYEVDDYETEYVPPLYTIIRANIICK